MSNNPTDGGQKSPGRFKQMRMVATVLRQADPKALPIVFGTAILTLALFVVLGLLFGQLWFFAPLGVLFAVLIGMIVFGQMAQRAQYKVIAGQPGAAAAILKSMRGNWTVSEAVSGNRNLDMVHRVVGRPGVILVSEGAASRVGSFSVPRRSASPAPPSKSPSMTSRSATTRARSRSTSCRST